MYAFLIFLGGATTLTRYKMTILQSDIGGIIAVLLVISLGVRYRVKLWNKYLFIFLGILSIWAILQSFKWNKLVIPATLYWDIVAGYVICMAYKRSIFKYFEKCMYVLCVIAIFLWGLSFLLPIMPSILKAISPNWINGLVESNILVFGLELPDFGAALFFRRNVGFAWEPGRFACFIAIAAFINLAMFKFRIRNNSHIWVFLLTLLSTQSTTGYVILVVIILAYLFNVRIYIKALVLSMSIPFVLYLFTLPFMRDKIDNYMIGEDRNETFVEVADYKADQDVVYVPQRFDGLLWEWYNFEKEPLLGYGTDVNYSYTAKRFNNKVVLYNGVIKILAVFGVFWGLMVYFLYYKGSVYFSSLFNVKGSMFFFIIFFMMNVSYAFYDEPVFLAMFLIPFFTNSKGC